MKLDRFKNLKELYDATLAYFKSKKMYRIDEFMPYYLTAMACHVLNIHNRNVRMVYARGGIVPDLRLHMFFIGPPGFSKSFFCDILFDETFGAAWDEAGFGFPNHEVGYLNLASLIGTVIGRDEEGNQITQPGLAETYSESIIWAEEFTGIREVMRTDYSAGMGDAFLKLCDNGKVERDMRYGSIRYQSYSTLLLGTQTMRIDLPSGLARRFWFIDLSPSVADIVAYRKAWHDGRKAFPDYKILKQLRAGYARLAAGVAQLRRVTFTKEYIKFLKSLKVPHIVLDLLERFAIGYNLMTNYTFSSDTLVVDISPELKDLINRGLDMRYRILGLAEQSAVIKLLAGQGWVRETEFKVKDCIPGIGMTYKQATKVIAEMVHDKLIDREKKKVLNSKKRVSFIRLVEEYERPW